MEHHPNTGLALFWFLDEITNAALRERSIVAEIFDALPGQLHQIELDGQGGDAQDGEGRTHLCDLLRHLKPQIIKIDQVFASK